MHRLNARDQARAAGPIQRPQRPRAQRGLTLIESLIALLVAALGILGVIGVQMRTLTDTSTTVRRAQAIRLIEDLGERMRTNPNAQSVLASYVTTFGSTPSVGDCSNGCTRAAQASYDLAVWKQAVRTRLPSGQASVFIPPAEAALDPTARRQIGVMVAWRENERADLTASDKQKMDATQVSDASGNLTSGAGSAATCPADHVCHLQYLPLAARCAPYKPGSASTQYFCPGA